MNVASEFMVDLSIHCTYRGVDDSLLWSFAVRRAVWFHSWFPNQQSDITTIELLKNTQGYHQYLLWSHVWRCSLYVLDPNLHHYQKIPRWNLRAGL